MRPTNVNIAHIMETSFCCMFVLFIIGVCGVNTQIKTGIVGAINNFLYSSCVLLPMVGEQDIKDELAAAQMQRALSAVGISTVVVDNETLRQANCSTSKPIQILLSGGPKMQKYVKEVPKKILSDGRWIIFMEMKPGRIEEFFREINIPIDCEFFVVQEGSNNTFFVSEVYRVATYLPLQIHRLDEKSNSNLYLRRNKLNGLVLRSVAFPMHKLLEESGWENGTVTNVTGYFGEVWNELQNRLNFRTEYINPPEKSYGVQLPNGTWDGLVGSMVRGEADVSNDPLQSTPERLQYVDFLIPIMPIKFSVYIRKPGISTNWDNFLDPFDTILWNSILIVIVIVAACHSVTWYIVSRPSGLPLWYILYESLFRIIGNFCNQGFDMNIEYSACRTILFTSYLTTTVLLAAYSAALISSLTVQDLKLPFRTFSEMLFDGQHKLGVMAGTAQITFFNNTSDRVLDEVLNKMIHPELKDLPKTALAGFKRICKRNNYAFFTSDYSFKTHSTRMPCSIVVIPKTTFESTLSMVVAKDSPYKNILNYYTKQLMRTGILKRLVRQVFPKETGIEEPSYQELDLQATIPLLAVIGVGIVLSIIILLLELVLHRFCTRCPEKMSPLKNICVLRNRNDKVSKKLTRFETRILRKRIVSEKYKNDSNNIKDKFTENQDRIFEKYFMLEKEQKVKQKALTRHPQLSDIACKNKIKT